jgi:hypothetical protein
MLTRFEKVRRFRSAIWDYGLWTLIAVAGVITAPVFFLFVGGLGKSGSQGFPLLLEAFFVLVYSVALWAFAGCVVWGVLLIPFCLLFGTPPEAPTRRP